MSTLVSITCRQISPTLGDMDHNRKTIAAEARTAAGEGAHIIIFPELASSGYTVISGRSEVTASAVPANSDMITEWCGLANELNVVLIAGYAEYGADGSVYNSAVAVTPTGDVTNYRKVHLWDQETMQLTPGDKLPPIIDTVYGRIGVLICYDLEFPELVRSLAIRGVDLICAPANWPLFPRPEDERPSEIVKVQANASVNRIAVAVCDRAGNNDSNLWVGGSVIATADGYPANELILGTAGSVTAEVDLAQSRDKQVTDNNNVITDRRPQVYAAVTEHQT